MPIDLKWIRNHPEQVQEWQTLRGLETTPSLTRAIPLDLKVRTSCHEISQTRRRINQVSNEMKDTQDRESLLTERRDLQLRLADKEQELKSTRSALQRALWTLGSPVDLQLVQQLEPFDTRTLQRYNTNGAAGTLDLDLSCHAGWHLSRAISNFAVQFLGRKYTQNHALPSQRELGAWQRTHLDLWHAMGGCSQQDNIISSVNDAETNKNTDDNKNTNHSSGCAICALSEEVNYTTVAEHTSVPGLSPITTTTCPAWMGWMAQSIPRKSIFGAKQLPRFTLLRGEGTPSRMTEGTKSATPSSTKKQQSSTTVPSEETIEWLAVTAGTTWDSRQAQMELAQELLALYQVLIVNSDSNRVTTLSLQAVPTLDLDRHEQSRVVVVATSRTTTANGNTTEVQQYPLGWVSNFGDSASRACDLFFKGGGLQDSKDFVHWVHATIIGPNTISNLIQCNVCHDQVLIPTCLQGEGALTTMLADIADDSDSRTMGLPVQSLRSKQVKNTLVPARDSSRLVAPIERQRQGRGPQNNAAKHKKATFGADSYPSTTGEALTCPFGFLIDQ
jgi:hypothetical protein